MCLHLGLERRLIHIPGVGHIRSFGHLHVPCRHVLTPGSGMNATHICSSSDANTAPTGSDELSGTQHSRAEELHDSQHNAGPLMLYAALSRNLASLSSWNVIALWTSYFSSYRLHNSCSTVLTHDLVHSRIIRRLRTLSCAENHHIQEWAATANDLNVASAVWVGCIVNDRQVL